MRQENFNKQRSQAVNAPVERVLAFGSKQINVILELQLENKIFLNAVGRRRQLNRVAKQRQAGQWVIILDQHTTTIDHTTLQSHLHGWMLQKLVSKYIGF